MTEDQVKAVFLLAGIEVEKLYEVANEYWPKHPDFDEDRRRDPWWLVKTKWGLIKIGWRKRVINIDWSDTGLRTKPDANLYYEPYLAEITRDDVTKWPEGVHAWGFHKAVEYLQELKLRLAQHEYAISEKGVKDFQARKERAEKEV